MTSLKEQIKILLEEIKIRTSKRSSLKRRNLSDKPSVMILSDVKGWAWDYKAQQLKRYLSSYYDIDILYWEDFRTGHLDTYITKRGYDLLFTFECNFVPYLQSQNPRKLITGITSHTYVNFKDYKKLIRRAYAVHANSEALFSEIRGINPNAFYVPNGVDTDLFRYTDRDISGEFTVGYVGKTTVRKGFNEFVVPACEQAGVKLKSVTTKYNHPEKRDRHQMAEFYKDVDVIMVASDMDGTPNQLLEAAASGRCFIANDIGNVKAFADGKNGFVVPRDVSAYVQKINYLKNNREICRQMGIEARKTAESGWSWKGQSENYRQMFDAVLAGCRNGAPAAVSA